MGDGHWPGREGQASMALQFGTVTSAGCCPLQLGLLTSITPAYADLSASPRARGTVPIPWHTSISSRLAALLAVSGFCRPSTTAGTVHIGAIMSSASNGLDMRLGAELAVTQITGQRRLQCTYRSRAGTGLTSTRTAGRSLLARRRTTSGSRSDSARRQCPAWR